MDVNQAAGAAWGIIPTKVGNILQIVVYCGSSPKS